MSSRQVNQKRNQTLSKTMKRMAEARKCPECQRGNATREVVVDGITRVETCRYCPYRKVTHYNFD